MEKDIQHERMQLQEVIDALEERLTDFKILLSKAFKINADYSKESLASVEKLLYRIMPNPDDDKDLLVEASLYVGECYRIMCDGKWDIAGDKENWGKPVIICNNLNKVMLFPFDVINEYLAKPESGFLEKYL